MQSGADAPVGHFGAPSAADTPRCVRAPGTATGQKRLGLWTVPAGAHPTPLPSGRGPPLPNPWTRSPRSWPPPARRPMRWSDRKSYRPSSSAGAGSGESSAPSWSSTSSGSTPTPPASCASTRGPASVTPRRRTTTSPLTGATEQIRHRVLVSGGRCRRQNRGVPYDAPVRDSSSDGSSGTAQPRCSRRCLVVDLVPLHGRLLGLSTSDVRLRRRPGAARATAAAERRATTRRR